MFTMVTAVNLKSYLDVLAFAMIALETGIVFCYRDDAFQHNFQSKQEQHVMIFNCDSCYTFQTACEAELEYGWLPEEHTMPGCFDMAAKRV